MTLSRTTRVLIASGAAVGLTIGGAVAYAALPTTPGQITACVQKGNGQLRVVPNGTTSCKKDESPLVWNTQGVPGTPGTNGTNGVSGYEVTYSSYYIGDVTSSVSAGFAECPAGKVATGGGAKFIREGGTGIISDTERLNITQTFPKIDGSGWGVAWDASDIDVLSVFAVQVFAMCVKA